MSILRWFHKVKDGVCRRLQKGRNQNNLCGIVSAQFFPEILFYLFSFAFRNMECSQRLLTHFKIFVKNDTHAKLCRPLNQKPASTINIKYKLNFHKYFQNNQVNLKMYILVVRKITYKNSPTRQLKKTQDTRHIQDTSHTHIEMV